MNPNHPDGKDRWHEKGTECPECRDIPRFNKSLRSAALNNHLYAAKEKAEKEKAYERTLGG